MKLWPLFCCAWLAATAGASFASEPRLYLDPGTAVPLALPGLSAASGSTLRCYLGQPDNSLYQISTRRYGTMFQLPPGTTISRMGFWYTGWQNTHGPYLFDVELWDVDACVRLFAKPDLLAPDAFAGPTYTEIELCADHVVAGGRVAFVIHPRTEGNGAAWPMLLTEQRPDDPSCTGYLIDYIGNIPPPYSPWSCDRRDAEARFLIQVDINDCPVPARRPSWGRLKTIYR